MDMDRNRQTEGIFIGLGSNLGDRKMNLEEAQHQLEGLEIQILSLSPLYESQPWGFESEHLFLNMCVEVATEKSPEELLADLHLIENQMGRLRAIKGYSDRVVDLDLLFYHDRVIQSDLKLPHPGIPHRLFVLLPMADIAPGFIHPELQESIKTLLDSCRDETKTYRLPG